MYWLPIVALIYVEFTGFAVGRFTRRNCGEWVQNWITNEMISGFSGGHLKGFGDPFWVKNQQRWFKIVAKMIQNRCLEGVWVVPGRLLAPDGFRGGSRDAPGVPRGASWVAFAAPNGAMLGARCAPRGLRKRKNIGMKMESFSHGPRRSVFLKIWWFWVVKRMDFER